jgi:hypothetical protein
MLGAALLSSAVLRTCWQANQPLRVQAVLLWVVDDSICRAVKTVALVPKSSQTHTAGTANSHSDPCSAVLKESIGSRFLPVAPSCAAQHKTRVLIVDSVACVPQCVAVVPNLDAW